MQKLQVKLRLLPNWRTVDGYGLTDRIRQKLVFHSRNLTNVGTGCASLKRDAAHKVVTEPGNNLTDSYICPAVPWLFE